MIYQSAFSIVSTILMIVSLVWIAFILILALVKIIISKIKYRKEQKLLENEHEKGKARFYGYDKRKKKG